MAAKQKADARPPPRYCSRMIPEPLLELYERASLFLDKKSTHQDHYWAVGIHRAIHASFPECGETNAGMTNHPGRLSCSKVSPQSPQAHPGKKHRSTVTHRASKEKRRRQSGPEQLAFKLKHEDRPDCRGHSAENVVRFRRFQRAVSMKVGQRVVLVCAMWSKHNQMPIESGTWGQVSEVGSTITVEWQLPYYRSPLWDRFLPDEYSKYFEEELEMNSFSL